MTQTGGIGTIQYMAPEVYKEEAQSYSVDVWSTGIIIYQLLSGDINTNIMALSADCGKKELPNELERKVNNSSSIKRSQTFIKLMKQMIQIDASERISPEEAQEKLKSEDS